MKLRDLFLPKIAHSNPEVRKKAVQKEKNTKLLRSVIEKDKSPDVRKTALTRLKELGESS